VRGGLFGCRRRGDAADGHDLDGEHVDRDDHHRDVDDGHHDHDGDDGDDHHRADDHDPAGAAAREPDA
jgi:hypothetical protein